MIGIGVGDPDHLTLQAVKALKGADVIFIPDKGAEKEDLRLLREEICRRHAPHARVVEFGSVPRQAETGDYAQDVERWHAQIASFYVDLLRTEIGETQAGALLVWGDPSLYDSTLRILETVRASGAFAFDCEVIPGITSVQALAARHGTTLNRIGRPVHVTTGRRLAAEGWPENTDSVVVMLDGEQAFLRLADEDCDIFWGAYLGTADEVLASGPLAEVGGEIARIRAEARERKGWIMDTYLLRKRSDG